MLLHYLGKLEVQIWWKLHCALKIAFYFVSFNSVKSTDFHNSFTAAATVNTFSSVKKIKSAANWKTFFRCNLQAVQFASVSSCARRLLKHFSCRSFRRPMMWTIDDSGMPVFSGISRNVLWVRGWSSWLRTISFTWSVFSSVPCGQFAVCRCPDVCPLCPCLWTSWTTC